MNLKKSDWVVCFIFCGFLTGIFLLSLCLPRQNFSPDERRFLSQPPQFSWNALIEGEFAENTENFLADHIPGRSFFVGLNAYAVLLSGRQAAADILPAEDNRLVEKPVDYPNAAVQKNMEVLNRFAQMTAVPVDLMLIPSAGWAAQDQVLGVHDSYPDASVIADIAELCGGKIGYVNLLDTFSLIPNPQTLYYKTDHHLNSLGAYTVCKAYLASQAKPVYSREDYRIDTISGFRGTTYSRSALWLTPGENLELWTGPSHISVTNEQGEKAHDGVFYPNRLESNDAYQVFLDGNHALVRLRNPDAPVREKLLVIRDSFCNCIGGFLADSYETIVLVDLRYEKRPVSQLMQEETFDRVLLCYGIGNFLTDTNIVWLR